MPKRATELSALAVRRLQRPGLHSVGGVAGLQLRVSDTGAKYWVLRVAVGGRRRDIGIGPYPEISLARARESAAEMREQVRSGVDPVEQRRAAQEALKRERAKALTFRQAAIKCHAGKETEFRSAKHRRDWISSLERHAFPIIGDFQVSAIELPHVLNVLEPIWHERTETATRVRQRMESVLTWATVSGYRTGENPARWNGNLKEVLPKPSKITKVKHHLALPWKEVAGFMDALRERGGIAARALEFLILTAARSSEVRFATWEELDLHDRVWTVPADRIKAGREHRVPLCDDAVKLLKAVPRMVDCEFVFPGARGGPLSDMTLTAVLKRMGVDVTVHGFRSTFKDWARNRSAYPDEVSELALAHVSTDATRAAYARDELLPQRSRLMADWARYVREGEPTGDVVSIRRP